MAANVAGVISRPRPPTTTTTTPHTPVGVTCLSNSAAVAACAGPYLIAARALSARAAPARTRRRYTEFSVST